MRTMPKSVENYKKAFIDIRIHDALSWLEVKSSNLDYAFVLFSAYMVTDLGHVVVCVLVYLSL